MTQSEAARALAPYLWECEKKEIHEKEDGNSNRYKYETVYFFNVNERIKNSGSTTLPGGKDYGKPNEATNCGFDSDQ